jgi:hypothetical protein
MVTMSVPSFQKLHDCKPGTGGIFGGTQGHILDVEYDIYAEPAENFGAYKPTYKYWNSVNKQWKNYKIGIMGVFHHTTSTSETLTPEDVKFVEKVMSNRRTGSKLIFIHISKEKFATFAATKGDGDKVEIKPEKFMVVGDMF